jgi:hypothetical protein
MPQLPVSHEGVLEELSIVELNVERSRFEFEELHSGQDTSSMLLIDLCKKSYFVLHSLH